MYRKLSLLMLLAILISPMVILTSAQGKTITVWITGSETDAESLQTAADVWADQTGNSVVVEAVPWSDSYARALAAVNAGEGADIIMGGLSWGISLGGIDGMIDLTERFPDEVAQLEEIANPGIWSSIVTVDGIVYAVPYNLDIYLMYYRPENLAALGVESAPATWEELEAALQAGARGGIGWSNASWLPFQNYLYQAGGTWYTEDCSAPAINSEEGLAALEFFTKLYEDYGFSADAASPGTDFSADTLDIVFDGEWSAPGINASFPELEGTWTVAPLPAGPSGSYSAFIGGKVMGIFSYSPNVDEAFDLIQFLSSEEGAQLQTEAYNSVQTLFLPPQPAYAEFIQGGEEVSEALAVQLEDGDGPPNCPGWEETNADVNLVLQQVIFEGMNFDDALAEMEDIMAQGLIDYGGEM